MPAFFVAGQVVLALCLIISTLILPQYFVSADQGGISNYGTSGRTAGWFIVGFCAAALGSLLSALRFKVTSKHQRRLRIDLYVMALLYTIVMWTTFSYKQNAAYQQLHEQASLFLFFYMLVMSLTLGFLATNDVRIKRAFVVLVIGLLIGLATLVGLIHLLFTAQIMAAAAFGYIVSRSLRLLS